ncbi:MAG: hypothetical protein LBV54_04525 [Puniceicoccales bacterium]|jgi:dihydrofolate synthase/folylpolyglutamate synthase|nr:hypothetical protein [Puniceicoccales bacterium]
MNYQEATRWLYSLKNRGTKFGIDRMALFAEALGLPGHAFPSILVAGSNGKGSTSAMLEAIYRAHGLRTGLYTSPHLVRLGERVQVDRVPLANADIVAYVEELRPVAERIALEAPDDYPSFFEFMTAMAFLEFQRRAVDIAIIEVGLGGRLDATNILTPRLSVITSISLEHTAILGDTLQKIAAEKGGIINPGVPVALGLLPAEANDTLHEIARERGAQVYEVKDRFAFTGDYASFPDTKLAGPHQRANAGLALLASEILRPPCPGAPSRALLTATAANIPSVHPESRNIALAALNNVDWAARWQSFPLPSGRRLIIDAAHNAECAAAIDPLLAQLVRDTGRAPLVITGVLGMERARPLLAMLAKHAAAFWLVRPEQDRACDFEEMESCIPENFTGSITRTTLDALFPAPGECAPGGDGDTIVVAGSVYLAGEVLGRFLPGGVPSESYLQDSLPGKAASPRTN